MPQRNVMTIVSFEYELQFYHSYREAGKKFADRKSYHFLELHNAKFASSL